MPAGSRRPWVRFGVHSVETVTWGFAPKHSICLQWGGPPPHPGAGPSSPSQHPREPVGAGRAPGHRLLLRLEPKHTPATVYQEVMEPAQGHTGTWDLGPLSRAPLALSQKSLGGGGVGPRTQEAFRARGVWLLQAKAGVPGLLPDLPSENLPSLPGPPDAPGTLLGCPVGSEPSLPTNSPALHPGPEWLPALHQSVILPTCLARGDWASQEQIREVKP